MQLWTTSRCPKLKCSGVYLITYTGEKIDVKGHITVEAKQKGSTQQLDILVVCGKGPSLMGWDWLGVQLELSQGKRSCSSFFKTCISPCHKDQHLQVRSGIWPPEYKCNSCVSECPGSPLKHSKRVIHVVPHLCFVYFTCEIL